MTQTKTVSEYNLTTAIDAPDYWQGHGVAFSGYVACASGCGSTPREALDDCLESLAQNDIEFSDSQVYDMEQELALDGDINEVIDEPSQFYVSIDVKFAE